MFLKILKYIVIGLLFIISFIVDLFSQKVTEFDRSAFYKFGSQFVYDLTVQPHESKDSVNYVVFYRVMHSTLTFMKNSTGAFTNYRSIVNLELIFKDKEGIIRKRVAGKDTILVDDFNDTKSKDAFLYSSLKFAAPINDYSLGFELTDQSSQMIQKGNIEPPNVMEYSKSPKIYYPLIADFTKNKNVFNSNCVSKKAPFSSKELLFLAPITYKNADKKYYFRITKSADIEADENWSAVPDCAGGAELLKGSLSDLKATSSGLNFSINAQTTNSEVQGGFLKIAPGVNNFTPGSYSLIIFNNTDKDTAKFNFEISWENMPLSLQNPEYALATMYYILSDAEYDKLESVKKKKMFKYIFEYWAPKDPTPGTPYNEAMGEYFKRADYAFFNYQSIAEKDGIRTDKGMIYILYGKPDEVVSEFNREKPREIWKYNKLKKSFTFELVSEAVYKIIDLKE